MPALHILIYGRDSMLLQTRQWLLEQAHYRVSTAETQVCAVKILGSESIDLCILCHTLSEAQRQSIKATAQELWPTMKTMQLITSIGKHFTITGENTLSTGDGPAALLSGVQKAVSLPITIQPV